MNIAHAQARRFATSSMLIFKNQEHDLRSEAFATVIFYDIFRA